MVRVLSLIAVLCLSACSKGTPAPARAAVVPTPAATAATTATAKLAAQTTAAGAATQDAPAVKAVPAQLPDVLARVNGETITKTDFEKAVKNIEARAGGPVPADQRGSPMNSTQTVFHTSSKKSSGSIRSGWRIPSSASARRS